MSGRRIFNETWKEQLHKSIAALLATKNEAVVYFARRDLIGEVVDPIHVVWELAEPRKILRKQSPDGSWAGPTKKTPVYPESHARLVATFKAFRTLVESYQFTMESVAIKKPPSIFLHFRLPMVIYAGLSVTSMPPITPVTFLHC